MLIVPTELQPMFTSFSLLYAQGYSNAPLWHQDIATVLTPAQTGAVEKVTMGWMDKIPSMRKWVGPRVLHSVSTRAREMIASPYELTMTIPKDKVSDDQWGLFSSSATDLGTQAAKLPDTLISDVLIANPTCFDGVSFFNDAHPVNIDDGAGGPLGTYDNSLALALTPANFGAARAAMMAFKGADGKPLGVRPTHLVVPPSLQDMAYTITMAENIASFAPGTTTAGNVGTTTNIYRGSIKVLVIPELEVAPTTWYLLDCSRAVRPLVYWLREAAQFVYLMSPDSPNVFYNREYVFGGEARAVADVSLPFLALKSTP